MPSRREALRLVGSALGVGIAGCAGNPDDESSPTQTASHSRSPTASRSPTSSPTDSPTATPLSDITLDDFNFDVTVAKQFSSQHPARSEASLTNKADTAITLDGGVSPPFSDYASDPRDDNEWLYIIPDMSESMYDEGDAISGRDEIPSTPTGNDCWKIAGNVTNLILQAFTTVETGESLTHPFDVYDFQGDKEDDTCLASGEYQFKNKVGLLRGGETPTGGDETTKEVLLEFTLTIHDDHSVSTTVPEPVIG